MGELRAPIYNKSKNIVVFGSPQLREKTYNNVGKELFLWATTYTLSSSRGIIVQPTFSMGLIIFIRLIALIFYKINSVVGVLLYTILFYTIEYIIRVTYLFRSLK